MHQNSLCSKRRANVYLKYIGAISLVIFYFTFLFRESLHAYEVNKGGNVYREENRQKIIPKRSRLVLSKRVNNRTDVVVPLRPQTTINPIYEYSEELHSTIERELYARKTHLWDACIRENLVGLYPPNAWEFFLSPGHNLAWCNVFKAASSTWMYYFNILGGYDIKYLQRTKTTLFELARKRFPRPKPNELNETLFNSVSFLIVRDPFERLLSAYRDKLEGNRNKYYKNLGKQIARMFRRNDTRNINRNKSRMKTKKSQTSSNNNLKRHNTGPTFKEFLLFLIKTFNESKSVDEHWAPVYKFCTPCSINYTLIAKVETFRRDTEYIIRQAGLETLLLADYIRKGVRRISNRSARKTKALIEKYFSTIDRQTLDQIIRIYRLDFELFDYDYKKYYDMVQPTMPTTILYTSSTSSSTVSSTQNIT